MVIDENNCIECPCYYYCSMETCIEDIEEDEEFELL